MPAPRHLFTLFLAAAACQVAAAQPPDFGRGGEDRGDRGDRGGFGRDRGSRGDDRGRDGGSFRGFGSGGPGSFGGGPPGGFGGGPPSGFGGGPPGGFGGGPTSGFGGGPPGGFGGGAPDPGRFFGFMDRNQDGNIDADEFERLPSPLRDRLQQSGLSADSPISRDAFSGAMQKAMEQRQQEGDSGRSDGGDRSRSSSSSSNPQKAKPLPFIRDLPEKYRPLDKNEDRQLGMYEWDRANLAEFRKFDLNGDGFLTPPELTFALTLAAKPAKSSVSAAALSIGVGLLSPPSPEDAAIREDALATFGRMDDNFDGGLDSEEWRLSNRVRPMIEQAGIKVAFPIRKAQFVASFVEAKKYQP